MKKYIFTILFAILLFPALCFSQCLPTDECDEDLDCDNGDYCDGTETCNLTTCVCIAGTAIVPLF